MEKILSVSVAAYNVESTLREALDPFAADPVRDLVEVWIVDDGSTDATRRIAADYEARYPDTFHLIAKENGGWGSTLNAAMQAATGRYFKQLDGDDYFSHENLADFLHFLSQTGADWVQSPYVTFEDGSGGIIRMLGSYEGGYRYFPLRKTIPIGECEALLPDMHSTTVRTALLQQNHIRILEHCFYTDVEFVLKSFNCCRTIAFYERPVYYYRLARSGQSMSLAGVRRHYRDHQKMLFEMLRYYQSEVKEPGQRAVIEKRLDGVCNMQYTFYYALACTPEQKRELIAFDRQLQQTAPDFYARVEGRPLALLRKTHFTGYKLVACCRMRKDRTLKRNLFAG